MADPAVYSEGLTEFPPRPGTLTLVVDELGLIKRYEGLFERIDA
jgi:hypothetical protein